VTADLLQVIDLTTGTVLWDSRALEIPTIEGYLAMPERGLLLLATGSTAGTMGLVAAELQTGRVKWRHAGPFAFGLSELVTVSCISTELEVTTITHELMTAVTHGSRPGAGQPDP
jgi:hypothetical protein